VDPQATNMKHPTIVEVHVHMAVSFSEQGGNSREFNVGG
jgi:hypothetical protein